MFRVAELRKRHIIGAKVRVFCVRHERCPVAIVGGGGGEGSGGDGIVEIETAHFVSHPLPLLNGSRSTTPSGGPALSSAGVNEDEPNSECSFEQNILMGLPHVIVHRMDALSPMMPPQPVWYDEGGVPHTHSSIKTPLKSLSDAPTESTADENTRTTASSSLLASAMEEGQSAPSSFSLNHGNDAANQPTQEEITHFLQDRGAEMIVFLEGICEVTGMALQARHSYRIDDIAFHQTFAPCVFPAGANASTTDRKKWWNPFSKSKAKVDQDAKSEASRSDEVYNFQGNAALEIDFSQFHYLQPAPLDSMSCPYIPSSSLRNR